MVCVWFPWGRASEEVESTTWNIMWGVSHLIAVVGVVSSLTRWRCAHRDGTHGNGTVPLAASEGIYIQEGEGGGHQGGIRTEVCWTLLQMEQVATTQN